MAAAPTSCPRRISARRAGLVAGAALLTDYVLTVSVSVAAGVAAILSAFPGPRDPIVAHRALLVAILAREPESTLRGVRETGTVFAIPTYVFVCSAVLALLAIARQPVPVWWLAARVRCGRHPGVPLESLSVLLVMRAFADGCSAVTGVEAIANGVPRLPAPRSRQCPDHAPGHDGRAAHHHVPGHLRARRRRRCRPAANHETVMSQIARATFGDGPVLYLPLLVSTWILVLAANTSFADFPRLASLLAQDRFMPSRFAFRGERLAFSTGIAALAVSGDPGAGGLPGGTVDALIPLYAIGVFTSITLSQAGMVRHWWSRARRGLAPQHRDQRHRRGRDGHRGGRLRRRQVRPGRLADHPDHPGDRRGDAVRPRPVRAAPARDPGPAGGDHPAAHPPPAGDRAGARGDPRRDPGDPLRPDDVRGCDGGPRDRRPRARRGAPRALQPAAQVSLGDRPSRPIASSSGRSSATSSSAPASRATT